MIFECVTCEEGVRLPLIGDIHLIVMILAAAQQAIVTDWTTALRDRLATGTPPEDITVRHYQSQGLLLDALTTAIQAAEIPLDSEMQRRPSAAPSPT